MRVQAEMDRIFSGERFAPSTDFVARSWHEKLLAAHKRHRNKWWERNPGGEQHRFTVVSGTGSGKTVAGAYIAYDLFGSPRRPINRVVVVCPTVLICKSTIAAYRRWFDMHLFGFNAQRHREFIPRGTQGYVTTYASVCVNPGLHRELIAEHETLVIADEVHHLGEKNSWGGAAVEAFGHARYVLPMSGTPYRHGYDRISLVRYMATGDRPDSNLVEFESDFQYTLGESIVDGYCRDPLFHVFDGAVMIRRGDTEESVSLSEEIEDDAEAADRLRGAVRYGSTLRKSMLRESLAMIRAAKRKVIIFLGGDSRADKTAVSDAQLRLPDELAELGIGPEEYEVVTGDGTKAHPQIKDFGKSKKWILISVNLISEGVDIPELSAAIFLTSITSMMTTMQRLGRILRRMGPDDPHDRAWAFFMADRRYLWLESEIRGRIRHEVNLARRDRGEPEIHSGDPIIRAVRTESIGVGNAELSGIVSHGHVHSMAKIEEKQRWLRERGRPAMPEDAVRWLDMECLTQTG